MNHGQYPDRVCMSQLRRKTSLARMLYLLGSSLFEVEIHSD